MILIYKLLLSVPRVRTKLGEEMHLTVHEWMLSRGLKPQARGLRPLV